MNDDTEDKLLSLRQVVLDRKLPRRMFVQVNTVLDAGKFNQGWGGGGSGYGGAGSLG